MALRFRRGTDAERQTITPKAGEPLFVTDTGDVYIGDGTTQGGSLISADLIDDGSPSLGGNLDLNNNNIVGAGNIDIDGYITATGNINLGDGAEDNIIVGGVISSSLIPEADGLYDLGSLVSAWRTGYFEGLNIDGTIESTSIQTGSIYGSDSSIIYDTISDSINVDSVTASAFLGDLQGSVASDDSSLLLVDSVSNELNTDFINISGNSIFTSEIDGQLNLSNSDSTGRIRLNFFSGDADFHIKTFGVTDGVLTSGTFYNTQRNSLEAPVALQIDDPIGSMAAAGWDGDSFVLSSTVTQSVDKYQSVSNGYMPGLIKLHTFETDTLDPSLGKGVEVDSKGNVGILTDYQSREALDVNGNAIFEGSITASTVVGALTADSSNVLRINGETGNTPSDSTTVTEWLEVNINGITRYLPLYS